MCIILRVTGFSDFVHRSNFYIPFYSSCYMNLRALSQILLHIFLLTPFDITWSQVFKHL
jgi:hypothetical protein